MTFDIATLAHNAIEQLSFHPGEPLMFNSGLFWVLMILFLPVYGMLRSRRWQMMLWVVAFSLFFAYKSSGWAVVMLVCTSVIDWWLALRIASTESTKHKKLWLWLSIVCSAGVLIFFKYSNFVIWNVNALVSSNFQPLDLALPIGLSFYTFRTISYVVDVYKGKIAPTTNYLEYLFFLSFFPCLVAGPIVRAVDFLPQLKELKPATRTMIYGGLWLFLLGVLKKAVVADYLSQYNDIVFGTPDGYTGVELLMAILGYTMQIYCDFSGYSDMAIGLGAVMGFDLGINFNFPYRSLSVTEFWRRWHISLSLWLRDYIYIGMGGNRKGKFRQYVNLMVTMLVGGLWHGAAWKFVLWGAGHGGALCIHKAFMPWLKRLPKSRIIDFMSWLLTMVVVASLWVFFRADDAATACSMLAGTVTRMDVAYFPVFFQVRYVWCLMMAIVIALHYVPQTVYDGLRQWFVESFWIFKLLIFVAVVQLVLEFAAADVQPFLYAQF